MACLKANSDGVELSAHRMWACWVRAGRAARFRGRALRMRARAEGARWVAAPLLREIRASRYCGVRAFRTRVNL
eukprot:424087-Prymnesium_polylepis.2